MGTVVLADVTELTTVKISELPELPEVDDEDIVPALDKDAMVTKGASRANLLKDGIADFKQIQGPYVIAVKEENVSNIIKGQVLCIKGATGNMTTVGLADCNDATKIRFLGLAFDDITQNGTGLCCYHGYLTNVDTMAGTPLNPNSEVWVEGDLLFVADIPGGLTNVDPTSGRRIKAARTRRGNHANDDLLILGFENPIWMTAASGENIVLRMGDNDGANKTSYRDYANNEVASIDSDGNLVLNGTTNIDHNDLNNIQGGTTNEYYHLLATEYTELSNWLDNVTLGSDGLTFAPEMVLIPRASALSDVVGGIYFSSIDKSVYVCTEI